MDFAIPADYRKESEKMDKYLDLFRELKNEQHEDNNDTSCN